MYLFLGTSVKQGDGNKEPISSSDSQPWSDLDNEVDRPLWGSGLSTTISTVVNSLGVADDTGSVIRKFFRADLTKWSFSPSPVVSVDPKYIPF